MTKPITWKVPARALPDDECGLVVRKTKDGNMAAHEYFDATPSDLVAAIRAMPAERRAEVLDAVGPPGAGWRCYTTQERDLARAHSRRCDMAITEAHAEAMNLEQERDAARLELRALRWVTFHSHAEARADGSVDLIAEEGSPSGHYPDAVAAARALGWEG